MQLNLHISKYYSVVFKKEYLIQVSKSSFYSHIISISDLSEWNCDHIRIWLNSVSKMFNIEKMPSVQKFPRTGKELRQLSR